MTVQHISCNYYNSVATYSSAVGIFGHVTILVIFLFSGSILMFGPVNAVSRVWIGAKQRFVFACFLFFVLSTSHPYFMFKLDVLCITILVVSLSTFFFNTVPAMTLDNICCNSVTLAVSPILLLSSMFFLKLGVLSLLLVLEISSLCFAIFAVSSLSFYDPFSINSFFWASALVSIMLTMGIMLFMFKGSPVISVWSLTLSIVDNWVVYISEFLIITASFVKLGIQPMAWWVRPMYRGLSLQSLLVYMLTFYTLNSCTVVIILSVTSISLVTKALFSLFSIVSCVWWLLWVSTETRPTLGIKDFLAFSTTSSILLVALVS